MGTFSKSLASIGGFIAANQEIIDALRHMVRTYIFSASCTPAATAAAREALRIIKSEPERLEALWNVTNYALSRFKEEGFEIGDTESPIIPLCDSSRLRSSRHAGALRVDGQSHQRTGGPRRCRLEEGVQGVGHHQVNQSLFESPGPYSRVTKEKISSGRSTVRGFSLNKPNTEAPLPDMAA